MLHASYDDARVYSNAPGKADDSSICLWNICECFCVTDVNQKVSRPCIGLLLLFG